MTRRKPQDFIKIEERFEQVVRVDDLGRLIQEKRKAEELTLAEAAEQSHVSAPTLSRLERQSNDTGKVIIPDTRTLTALTQWLGVSVEQMLGIDTSSHGEMSTPDIVKAHLRADRKLNSEAAEALSEMFRLAYTQFSRPNSTSAEDHTDKPERLA